MTGARAAVVVLLIASVGGVAASVGALIRGAPRSPVAPVRPATESSGFLDYFATGGTHARLERLLFEDRHVEAFGLAVAELRARAERHGPTAPATLAGLQWVAAIAASGGDRRTADELFEALLAIRSRRPRPDDPVLAETLLRRGRAARSLDDFETARRCVAEARRILAARGVRDNLAAFLEQTEASLHLRTDLEAAARGYRESLAIRGRLVSGPDPSLAGNLTWLGWTLDRLGRPEEAAPHILEARRQLRALGLQGVGLEATLQQLQADQQAFEGRWSRAEPLYRAAAASNSERRNRVLGGFARRAPLDGFEELALAAVLRGEGDAAWVLLQKGRAATYRDFAALSLWARRSPMTFGPARSTRSELLEVTRRLATARRLGRSPWEDATWRLTLEALELRARLASLEAAFLEAHGPPEPSLGRTQALLDPRTAIVGWLDVNIGGDVSNVSRPRRSWGLLYVIRDTGPVRWVTLWEDRTPPEVQMPPFSWGHVMGTLRRAAEWPLRVDPDPTLLEHLREWTKRYFDPALPHLRGVDRLVVEGSTVPLELHRDAAGRFLIDRLDVSYAPSASFLVMLGRGRPGRAPRSALSLAASPAPLGAEEVVALALADDRRDLRPGRTSFARRETSLDRLPHLRFAGLEAGAVARRFPSATVLRGGTGVERDLSLLQRAGRLRHYDIIHVAGHTLFDAAAERCGLALAEREPEPGAADDGVLDAEEILLGWELDGALLTLSACESAHAAGIWRGEDLGLTPALFAAGASRVLVSLWSVDDRATAVLMDRFYRNLAPEGTGEAAGGAGALPPAAALREAKIYVRDLTDATGRRPFEHPAYWAGFVLIGPPDPDAGRRPAAIDAAGPRRAR